MRSRNPRGAARRTGSRNVRNLPPLLLLPLLAVTPAPLAGQAPAKTFEVHALLTGLDLGSSTGEGSGGLGIRAGWNAAPGVGLEAETAYFPENGQGNYGHRLLLAGARVGHRWGRLGVRAKARPGLLHLGGSFFQSYNGSSLTLAALDLGLAVEYHFPNSPALLRLDIGRTAVFFGDRTIIVPALDPQVQPGTTWNQQGTLALGIGF